MCANSITSLPKINFSPDFDWRLWIKCWDRMQDYYIHHRKERFGLMVRLIADTQQTVHRILDVGCGTGSLMLLLLERFPESEIYGIDFDPTLLALAEKRLSEFAQRVHLVQIDFRDESWLQYVPIKIDADVSATALHWLSQEQLARFYVQLAKILRPRDIFLNADHVRSTDPAIQSAWQQHREQMRKAPTRR
jgi:trans-aconitate methyltransferase